MNGFRKIKAIRRVSKGNSTKVKPEGFIQGGDMTPKRERKGTYYVVIPNTSKAGVSYTKIGTMPGLRFIIPNTYISAVLQYLTKSARDGKTFAEVIRERAEELVKNKPTDFNNTNDTNSTNGEGGI